ncbi:hypothetical protein ALO68_101422 [Pseudomonas syringae pv. helianthi]|uniref:Uncharacterized protein n=3 Tax=Pseudomonas syringae group TaxID=136849 RepID=A0A0N8QRL6_9PSED|nr:hypothetical protein ALO80_101397 [Pseudomonas caricapapayae]KPX46601.1 hypothetical protein ALO68_101422 [Pseudomonas syringae pv. helianthi]KPY81793.1 hypothetical protein ALO44_101323 [Pseudomonas syringae pv. tagetis]RMM06660.1 hypothetical protein ALQ84_101234 [Pseudomonas caricapapayae]RMR05924.1 hypothetical protein ALP93_101021 [Pseudomonas syringae pv. helianthi]
MSVPAPVFSVCFDAIFSDASPEPDYVCGNPLNRGSL